MPKIKDTFSDKNISDKSNKSTILSKPAGRCDGNEAISLDQNKQQRFRFNQIFRTIWATTMPKYADSDFLL